MHARTCLIMVAAAIMMAGSTVLADGFDAAKWQSFTEYSKYIHVDPGEFYGFGSLSFTEWSNPFNEDFYLRFSIKNIGSADAETVSVKVKNNQSGVLLIGVVDGNNLQRRHPQFAKIAVDKHEMVTYRFFVNTDFKDLYGDMPLQFTVTATERYRLFGFLETKTMKIGTKLGEEGKIQPAGTDDR